MMKRVKITSAKGDNKVDRISSLPDELLVLLLSFLTFKEATATSVLSRRWRSLWTYMRNLDIDGTKYLLIMDSLGPKKHRSLHRQRRKYLRRVNHVLACQKNSTIDEFKIDFDLDKTYKDDIDKWVEFALDRKVKNLQLKLLHDYSPRMPIWNGNCYTFPYRLLSAEHENSSKSYSWSIRSCSSFDFNYLQSILMEGVNVNAKALEFFLCNCPVLEHLSVSGSDELKSLDVSTSPLKRLEIRLCKNLKSLKIHDINLIYLNYEGNIINDIVLDNVPLLVELFVRGTAACCLNAFILMFSSILPKLDILTLDARLAEWSWEDTEMFYSSVRLGSLKQLMVRTWVCDDDSLLPLTNLVRAAPCLQRFKLEAIWGEPLIVKRKLEKVETSSYVNLKEVVFTGYHGRISDLELIMHFVKNAIALEKVIIDPSYRCHTSIPNETEEEIAEYDAELRAARTRAKSQFKKRILHPRISLDII